MHPVLVCKLLKHAMPTLVVTMAQRGARTAPMFATAAGSPIRLVSSLENDEDIFKARKAAELKRIEAELRKVENEAAAHAEKVKAEAAEAVNRAEKVKTETEKVKTETETMKTEADAFEYKVKTEADAFEYKMKTEADANEYKVKTEADANAEKAKAETWSSRLRLGLRGAWVVGIVGITGFLYYDHYTHNNRDYLRMRIKEKFLAGPDESVFELPSFPLLPLPPLPIDDMNPPLVIVGPSGSGKSTQLMELAKNLKDKHIPVVYIRFRASDLNDKPTQHESSTDAEPNLKIAAQRLYEAIGYPERTSYVSRFGLDSITFQNGKFVAVASLAVTANRFQAAITDMYAVAIQLHTERKKNPDIKIGDRQPVILADELHDLLHDRLNSAGGQDVFSRFGSEMTLSDVDYRASRTILAGSGSDLFMELERRTTANLARLDMYTQPDPDESIVRKRLTEMEYDPESVNNIIRACGTRLRLLSPFLRSKMVDPSSRIKRIQASANTIVRNLMAMCPDKEERAKLVAILDELAKSPSSSVNLERLPQAVQDAFPRRALLQLERKASFQTEAVRQAWLRIRSEFC